MRQRSYSSLMPLTRLRLRASSGDSGAAAVEFALVVPVFLLLVFGMVEMGFVISHQSKINSLATATARFASLGPSTTILTRVEQAAAKNSGTLKADDYVYVFSPDSTGEPIGSTDADPCPVTSCTILDYNGSSFVQDVGVEIPTEGTSTTTVPTSTGSGKCTDVQNNEYVWDRTGDNTDPSDSKWTPRGGIGRNGYECPFTSVTKSGSKNSRTGAVTTQTITRTCTVWKQEGQVSGPSYVELSSTCSSTTDSDTSGGSSTFNPATLSGANGCALGIYVNSSHNWLSGFQGLFGWGSGLDLESQTVVPMVQTGVSTTCGAQATKVEKHPHDRKKKKND